MLESNKLKALILKYREVILYLFFGGLAFVVSISTYYLFAEFFRLNELIANVLSWIITVLFAFLTNKAWVFRAATNTAKEYFVQLASFFSGRVVTLLIEESILLIFVTWLDFNGLLVKICAQIVVIVLNYILSKLFVFK